MLAFRQSGRLGDHQDEAVVQLAARREARFRHQQKRGETRCHSHKQSFAEAFACACACACVCEREGATRRERERRARRGARGRKREILCTCARERDVATVLPVWIVYTSERAHSTAGNEQSSLGFGDYSLQSTLSTIVNTDGDLQSEAYVAD